MIERRQETQAAPTNGAGGDANGASPVPLRRKRAFSLRAWTMPTVLLTLIPVLVFGVLYIEEQLSYVVTDNAQVTGTLAQLGPVAASQLRTVTVDVGDEVVRNEPVASLLTANGQLQSLRAPFDGVVVARFGNPGDALTAGKAVLALLNPAEIWVEARVEEWQANRVRAGQRAEVTVDALAQTVQGHVTHVGSASLAAVAAGSDGSSFGAGRARQLVPVRVQIDHEQLHLFYGGLAHVKILTR